MLVFYLLLIVLRALFSFPCLTSDFLFVLHSFWNTRFLGQRKLALNNLSNINSLSLVSTYWPENAGFFWQFCKAWATFKKKKKKQPFLLLAYVSLACCKLVGYRQHWKCGVACCISTRLIFLSIFKHKHSFPCLPPIAFKLMKELVNFCVIFPNVF